MYIDIKQKDIIVLISSLDVYQAELSEREKRADYWFRSHQAESYKERAEENRVLIEARMLQVDQIKEKLLSNLSDESFKI